MMKNLKIVLAGAVFLIGTVCIVSDSQARVCFATDSDCDTGVEFYDQNSNDELKQRCIEEGYTQTSCPSGDFKYNCPYKTTMLKCCSQDYGYTNCSYPLVKDGKCGGKYRCKCDNNKYKYSFDGFTGSSKCVNNATPGGTSCVHQVLNSSGNGLDLQTFYTECRCDRALFPYSPGMCDSNAATGDVCKDTKGDEYYSICYCDRQVYPKSSTACFPFVGAEESGHCTSGGVTYYKTCKSCDGYPARDLKHVSEASDRTPNNEDYEACPYAQTDGYYKIFNCREPGYRVSVNGDYDIDEDGNLMKDSNGNYITLKAGEKCVIKSCMEMAKEFVKKNPNYGILSNSRLVDENGRDVKRIYGIVPESTNVNETNCYYGSAKGNGKVCKHYCCRYKKDTNGETVLDSFCRESPYGGYDESWTSLPADCINNDFVCDSIQYENININTDGGLACLRPDIYYSGGYLAIVQPNNPLSSALKKACKREVPTITYIKKFAGNAAYPNRFQKGTVSLYGIKAAFPSNTDIKNAYFYNSNISATADFHVNGYVNFNKNNVDYNQNNMSFTGGNLLIDNGGRLFAKGYNISFNTMNVENEEDIISAFFEGSTDNYITFRGNRLGMKGHVGLKYANAYVGTSCIGCIIGNNSLPEWRASQVNTAMELIDSNWYMYEGTSTFTVFMHPGGFIGNNDAYASVGTSHIVYRDSVYPYISSRYQYKNCDRCNNYFGRGYYITSGGYLQSLGGTGCSRWCDSSPSHSKDYGDHAICAINGNKDAWFDYTTYNDGGKDDCFLEAVFNNYKM